MGFNRICALLPTAFLAAAQAPNPRPGPEEVRIHSAIYAPPPALTIAAQAQLVQIAATVRDRKGRATGGWKAGDFELLDNGARQEIAAFSEVRSPQSGTAPEAAGAAAPAPARPRYLALFFDDSHTGMAGLERTRKAAEKLVETGLQPGDRLGIFTDSGTVTQDFTSDKAALLDALARLRPHSISNPSAGQCPALSPLDAYLIARNMDLATKQAAVGAAIGCYCPPPQPTAKGEVDASFQACASAQEGFVQDMALNLWDRIRPNSSAMIESITLAIRHLARMPGDRVLILVSSGFLAGGLDRNMAGLTDTAIRSHVVIHALHAEGLLPDRKAALRTQVYTQPLASAANGTGGQLIKNSNDFVNGLRTLSAPPAVSYLLGFSPQTEPDGMFHSLKLRVASRSGFEVDARPGYYYEVLKKAETVQQRIDREAVADGMLTDFPAIVRISQADGRIRVDVQVDLHDFEFAEQAGRWLQQLTFVTVLRDSDGNYVAGRQAVMDLALTPEKLADFRANGLRTNVSLDAPKGSYQLREVIREAGQNRMTASTTPIHIR